VKVTVFKKWRLLVMGTATGISSKLLCTRLIGYAVFWRLYKARLFTEKQNVETFELLTHEPWGRVEMWVYLSDSWSHSFAILHFSTMHHSSYFA
jgi:hypothetical protein